MVPLKLFLQGGHLETVHRGLPTIWNVYNTSNATIARIRRNNSKDACSMSYPDTFTAPPPAGDLWKIRCAVHSWDTHGASFCRRGWKTVKRWGETSLIKRCGHHVLGSCRHETQQWFLEITQNHFSSAVAWIPKIFNSSFIFRAKFFHSSKDTEAPPGLLAKSLIASAK